MGDGPLPRLQFWSAMFGRGWLQEKAHLPAFGRKSAASPPMCFLKRLSSKPHTSMATSYMPSQSVWDHTVCSAARFTVVTSKAEFANVTAAGSCLLYSIFISTIHIPRVSVTSISVRHILSAVFLSALSPFFLHSYKKQSPHCVTKSFV